MGALRGCRAGGPVRVRAIVGGAPLRIYQRLISQRHLPEDGGIPAMVGMCPPGSLAVSHFDLFVRRRHRKTKDLVMGAAALGQTLILFL
ncbi:hypothetical protein FQZ97_1056780 [compost metagenome]